MILDEIYQNLKIEGELTRIHDVLTHSYEYEVLRTGASVYLRALKKTTE